MDNMDTWPHTFINTNMQTRNFAVQNLYFA